MKKMKKLNLKSLVKKCAIYYGYLGLGIGVILFGYSFFDSNFTYSIGTGNITGLMAGIAALTITPAVMAVVGVFHAPIIWYPVLLILGYRRKSE